MKEKLTTLGRNHPKALGVVFTALLLTGQFLTEVDISPLADSHPGP
ncbi:hypothetical protein [Halorussus caseinilyticus]|uniref:Uncharacterized protein n=1 Tax=Halorussus caseinilyticus TaxID=3034025 RepID=A0ABD5WIJ3_9EURY|nr:hypothetical protein [Halorussus sp. DT72]